MLQLRRVKPHRLSSTPCTTIRLAQHRRTGTLGRDPSGPSPEGKSRDSQTYPKHPTSFAVHNRATSRRRSKWTPSSTHPTPSTNASEADDKTEKSLAKNVAVKPYTDTADHAAAIPSAAEDKTAPLIAPDKDQVQRAAAECANIQARLTRRRVGAHGLRGGLLKALEAIGGGVLHTMQRSTHASIARCLLVSMDKLDAMAARIVSSQNIPERAMSHAEEMALALHYRIYVGPRVMEHLRAMDASYQTETNPDGWNHDTRRAVVDFARCLELALKGLDSIAGLNPAPRSKTVGGNYSASKHDSPVFAEAFDQPHSHSGNDLPESSSSDAMLTGSSSDADSVSTTDSELLRTVPSLRIRKLPPNSVVRKYEGKSDSITLSRSQLRRLIERNVRETLQKTAPAKSGREQHSTATSPEPVKVVKSSTEAVAPASHQSLYEELFPNEAKGQHEPPLNDDDDDAVPRLPLPKPQQPDALESVPDSGPRIFKNHPLRAQPDHAAVLVLYNASKSLTEDDFRRIEAPRSKSRPWAIGGSFIAVMPVRDPQTLDRKSTYYLIFPSLLAARTYRERAYYLWTLAKSHTRTAAGLMAGAVAAPDSVVDPAEDVFALAKGFALVPPSQKLDLEILPRPYSPLIQNLMRRGGYAQVVGDRSAGGDKVARVMLKFDNGMQPSRKEIDEAIGMDIRARGVAWRFDGQDHIKKLDVERFVFDAEDTPPADGQGGRSKMGFTTQRWILSFEDRTEARRFARQWHLRKFPWKNPATDNGMEQNTIVVTELLW